MAADAELVGLLALATQDKTIEQLELDGEQVEKLYALLDSREDAAIAVASEVRDLSPDERDAKLQPLRVESQRLMAGILSDSQITALSKLAEAQPNEYYEPLGSVDSDGADSDPADSDEPAELPAEEATEAPATEEMADPADSAAEESASEEATAEEPAAEEATAEESTEQPAAEETIEETPAVEPPVEEQPRPSRFGSREGDSGSSRFSSRSESRFGPPEDRGGPDDRMSSREDRGPAPSSGAKREDFPQIDSDGKLSFSFRYQPWQDVLDWFAEQNELSLLLESPPSGTFNYTDPRRYTPAEALDVLNSVLLTKGYTLVRREKMLVLVNLEDGVPPNLVTDVPLEDIDQRGEFELIRVLFRVRNMTPEAASEEVSRLIGPQGKVVVLPRAGMLQVTETAGRIRAIREVIQAIEKPGFSKLGDIKPYNLQYASAATVMPVLRQMLSIPADAFSTADGTLQLGIDSSNANRLLAFGTPEMVQRLEEVLTLVDVPGAAGPLDALQLEVYPISKSDPDAALLVLQTLLSEEPGTRLALDPQTGNLVALATMANHATIRATLSQMQEDAREIEVIPLAMIEPQLAILSINKLFGITGGEDADPRAPIVDADLTSNSLIVRGTKSQIEQIKTFLSQMGESDEATYAAAERGNIRFHALSSSEARSALDQIQSIWPSLRTNQIKMVTPSQAIKFYTPAEQSSPDKSIEQELEEMLYPNGPDDFIPAPAPSTDRETRRTLRVPTQFAAYSEPEVVSEVADETPATQAVAEVAEEAPQAPAEANPSKPGAPIMVAPGPSGLIIASDDLDALDAFEQLLEASTSQSATGREYAVFYLKHAKAATASAILSEIYGAATSSGGDLMSGIMDNALGDIGGGLMGDLLGLGGSSGSSSGFSAAGVDIVTDVRLNAIIVYARPDDIDMVFRLLQVLDQRIGPTEIEAEGVPRLIPVVNTTASQVAEVVKQLYSSRLEGGGGNGQPSPEDLIRALRNGGGGGGADSQEQSKMTIGVDTRSNSLIVKAEDALFFSVKALVEQLDTVQEENDQVTTVLSFNGNGDALKDALSEIYGENAVSSTTQQGQNTNGGNNNNGGDARAQQEMIRRIQEFRSRMQGGGGGGRGGGGAPGGGAPGGGGRGGGGRGGGGRG